jgi:hypothetical protein
VPMWLVRVMPDRRVLYRSVALTDDASSTPTPEDNGAGNRIEALRGEIAVALKAQGLYEDEAKAMLETWRLSYFESEGVRLFFVLPRSWTDAHLPLSISTPADVTRVMLGRIELVSAHQRTVLEQLLKLPESAFDIRPPYFDSPEVQESMAQGRGSHAEYYRMMGKPVPEALTLYDSLGRFRDALLAHELRATQDQLRKARLASIMQRFGACELSGG